MLKLKYLFIYLWLVWYSNTFLLIWAIEQGRFNPDTWLELVRFYLVRYWSPGRVLLWFEGWFWRRFSSFPPKLRWEHFRQPLVVPDSLAPDSRLFTFLADTFWRFSCMWSEQRGAGNLAPLTLKVISLIIASERWKNLVEMLKSLRKRSNT